MIPSVETCFRLMAEHHMLDHIRRHSVVVARIAVLIARGLRDAGAHISVPLVTAGALLHDIGKTPALRDGQDHSEVGRRICAEHHLDKIGELVGEHVQLRSYDLNGEYSEKEIVYYSDKRVNHDEIVSLEGRRAYILEKYAKNHEALSRRINENFELCTQVEKKLFRDLSFTPDDVPRLARQVSIGFEP